MTSNGLNFLRSYTNNSNLKVNIDEMLELKKMRIEEREKPKTHELAIEYLCEAKSNYVVSRPFIIKTATNLCTCWSFYEEFIDKDIKDDIECEGLRELNVFNSNLIQRFQRCFLKKVIRQKFSYSDPVSWKIFSENEKINRILVEKSRTENEIFDLIKDKHYTVSVELWKVVRKHFNSLMYSYNSFLMKLLSNVCKKCIESFNASIYDLSLLSSLKQLKVVDTALPMDSRPINNPLVYVTRCKASIDYFLLQILFKEMGMEPPVFLVPENSFTLSIKSFLTRIGYIVVKEELLKDKTFKMVLKEKLSMLLVSNKALCIIQNYSVSSQVASKDDGLINITLQTVVELYNDGNIHDPVMIPVILNHELIPEAYQLDNSSIWTNGCLMNLSAIAAEFGKIKLTIAKPVYYGHFNNNLDSRNELDKKSPEKQLEIKVDWLLQHIVTTIYRYQLIMPTNLVAFAVLYMHYNQSQLLLSDLVKSCEECVRYLLPHNSSYYEQTPIKYLVMRGCRLLYHILHMTKVNLNDEDGAEGDAKEDNDEMNCEFIIHFNYNDFQACQRMNFYADVTVNSVAMRSTAALTFMMGTKYRVYQMYLELLKLNDDYFYKQFKVNYKKFMSSFFQFLLPCESLDNILAFINSWWSEVFQSESQSTETQWMSRIDDNRSAGTSYRRETVQQMTWSAAVYNPRINRLLVSLARSLGPRFEALLIVLRLMLHHKSLDVPQVLHTAHLYNQYCEEIKSRAQQGLLLFYQCLSREYFIVSLKCLYDNNTLSIIGFNSTGAEESPDIYRFSADLWNERIISTEYLIDSDNYFVLQRYHTFIENVLLTLY